MTSTAQEQSFICIKGQVAKILLDHAEGGGNGQNRLAQRDIASMLGTNWISVHQSLKSLYGEGVIRIEGNRIILNKELILKATA